MSAFDPNAAAAEESNIFGLPSTEEESAVVFLPVPWEATTSYGGGTSEGPQAILAASKQVDLFDLEILKPYEAGLFMLPESDEVRGWNLKAKALVNQVREGSSNSGDIKKVNELGDRLNQFVYQQTKRLLGLGKQVGIIGGDHSVPFGAFQAIAEAHPGFGILHFDAHSDTRRSYEGFSWSHASIMYNALTRIPQISKLIQVGIRDFCEEENDWVTAQGNRAQVFYDGYLSRKLLEGSSWKTLAEEIIAPLPEKVWISFDIDGLDPRFCPHTGTPVPGGLDFQQANYIFNLLVRSGRKIIGFDLNEVAPNQKDETDEWDANVGARLLYKLTGWMLASQGKVQVRF